MQEIENAKKTLEVIQINNADITKWFDNPRVTSVAEQKNYEEILAEAKKRLLKVQAEQDKLLAPLKETEKGIRNLFKSTLNKYSTAILSISSILDKWRKQQLALTDAQIVQEATTYIEQQKEATKTGEIIPLPDLGVTALSKTSRHNMGSTTYIPHIIVTISDPNLVPREWCIPSESLLKKAGELAFEKKLPLPVIEGVILEVRYTPRSNPLRS